LAGRIETQLEGANSIQMGIRRAARAPLADGASTEFLAILSAYMLGLLTNASYDVIKWWLLSKNKQKEAEATIERGLHYSIVVEVIDSHVRTHPDIAEQVKSIAVTPPRSVLAEIELVERDLASGAAPSGEKNID
jgi:hypothetical protein